MSLRTMNRIKGDLQQLKISSLAIACNKHFCETFLLNLSNEIVFPIHILLLCHVQQLGWLIRGFSGNNPQLLPDQLAHLVCTIVCIK